MKNERKSGVILSYVNIFLNLIVTLFYTPFVLRILGQSEFGLFSLAMSIIGYLVILDFGLGNAIIVFTSKYRARAEFDTEKTLHGTVFTIYIIMSVFAILAGVTFSLKVEYFFGKSMSIEELNTIRILFLILTLNIAITLPMNIYTAILNAYEKFTFLKVITIIRTLLMPIVILPLLFLGYKSIVMVASITIINFICLGLNFWYYRKNIGSKISIFNFKFDMLKIVCSYSFFIFLTMVVDQINWQAGNFIIGSFLGTKDVAIFSIAVLINTSFMILSTAVSGVMLPKISTMVSQGVSNSILTDEMIKIGRLQNYIIFFILSTFFIFGREFIILWAGKSYEMAYLTTMIMMIPLAIPLIQNLGLSILQAKNRFKFKAITTLVGAIFNIIISIILVPKIGIIGAALGTCFNLFIINGIIINIFYHKKIGLDMYKFWLSIIRIILPLVVLAFIIFCLYTSYKTYSILHFISFTLLYGLCYFTVSYKFCMNDYEKAILNSAFVKIGVKFKGDK
ncbi:oligosaccharide flippase family protein [Campylobacter geochelonis]|uniref:Virulence factor MviN family protein n=1 Tax=Campylobacter geochelonis TaxID=1780362 RepID=A0A128EJD5_9BACT|nr:oligosaccharide flippase family protein [Campylobacter geochelonis]QKF71218.1 flippase [Campylobacter geochelonis]CZE48856.1 virulence factor MviN family protein [Campylobacter geochelonis]